MKNEKERRISKTPREPIIKTARCVKHLKYRNINLGTIITETQVYLTERETLDLIREMPQYEKIHMEEQAYPIHRLCKAYGITQEQYLSNADIMIHAADRGYKNLKEVKDNDPKIARLIKERGLKDELFQDFSSLSEQDSFIEPNY